MTDATTPDVPEAPDETSSESVDATDVPSAPEETHAAPEAPETPAAPKEAPALEQSPTEAPKPDRDLRRRRGRAVLLASGRAVLALSAAAAAAALAIGVMVVPAPTFSVTVPTVSVTPDRAAHVLVCAGGALGLTRGADPQLTVVAEPRRSAFGEGLVEGRTTAGDAGTVAIVTLPPTAPSQHVAATEILQPSTPDVSGLAAAECLTPSRSAWLVGGSTTVGRTSWVVLSNADPVDAVVDLRLWGAGGPREAPGTSGIVIPAGQQRVVPLAGLAVDEPSPVVQVTSSGGSVAATLQTSVVRGLSPDGLSVVTPVSEPSTSHIIPALPVIGLEAALERFSADGGADALTAVRMLAPGDVPADVTVTLVPAAGGLGLSATVTLDPGVVLDLPFADLADGEYAVVVDASTPIVVAGRTSVVGVTSGVADVEWFTPSVALAAGSETLAATPPLTAGQLALLHLYAPADAVVEVDGLPVAVTAGQTVALPVAGNAGLRLRTDASVFVSVSYRADGLLAGSRVLPPPAASGAVTVLPG